MSKALVAQNMKYLVITADYNTSGIKDEFEGDLEKGDVELSDAIWNELENWVSAYQEIIPMTQEQRALEKEKIAKLDKTGIAIKQKVIEHFNGEVKIKYYSEGLLKYIV